MKEYLRWLWNFALETFNYHKVGAFEGEGVPLFGSYVDYYVPKAKNLPKRIGHDIGTVLQNQGRTNHCTAYSGAHALSIMRTMKEHSFVTVEGESIWGLQLEQGTAKEDRGDYIESAPQAMLSAELIKSYQKVKDEDFKKALVDGKKILTGARVGYPMCDRNWLFKTGGNRGGHAFLIIGYDDDLQCFIAANSWGENWGVKSSGVFHIRYTDVSRLYTPFVLLI